MRFIKTICLVAAAYLNVGLIYSQEVISTASGSGDIQTVAPIVDDTWLAPVISDEMTTNPEQNRQWRLGQSKYPAQPKDMWEFGLHGGHFFIDGDVDRRIPGGFGLGGHLRKSFNYITSIRFDAFYGQARGLETQPWKNRSVGGGLVESNEQFRGWDAYNPLTGGEEAWFPAYKTTYIYGAAQLVFNIGNILFHQERNKWNTYVALGVGLDHHKAKLDLTDANGDAYGALIERTGFNSTNDFNTKAGRDAIKAALDAIYDGTYETEGFKKEGIFRIGDDFNIHAVFTASVGVSRKISKRFNIGLEHQLLLSDNDYLDGVKFRTALDQTNNVDVGHYTNVRMGFNLGNFSKRTEPLYWLNPMGPVFSDIADLKARPQLDLNDDDGDGVLNLLDQELDTPEGCLVDTKGITLDSDGDGIADCKDKEPFSPPGYPIDEFGVAQIDKEKILTEEDVITIIKNNCHLCQNVGYGQIPAGQPGAVGNYSGTNVPNTTGTPGNINNTYGTIVNTGCGNWFLPMLHFDLDKYAIRPESYPKLHQIATVMKNCPDMCVTAHGHTDVRNSNRYNRVLSYNRAKMVIDYLVANYGIDRSRFKLMFGGEDSPLIPHLKDNHYTNEEEELMQFINRRVEFRVCNIEDVDMPRPEGPPAGVNSYGSSRPGSKYKGHKNSGF